MHFSRLVVCFKGSYKEVTQGLREYIECLEENLTISRSVWLAWVKVCYPLLLVNSRFSAVFLYGSSICIHETTKQDRHILPVDSSKYPTAACYVVVFILNLASHL